MRKVKHPVSMTVWIVLFCLSVSFLAIAQEKKYEALLGKWDVQTEDGQYTFVFIFALEEGKLTGTFEGQSGEAKMENLSFEGNKVTFTVNVEAGGQTMPIDFSATIEGDTLEGYLSLQYGEANITGEKRK